MSLILSKRANLYKKLFTLKPPQRDGLILSVNNADEFSHKRSRIIISTFNTEKAILALCDNNDTIFLLDFRTEKFWNLPENLFNIVLVVQFSSWYPNELFIGDKTGTVTVINIETGQILGELHGHRQPVTKLSFSSDNYHGITSNSTEAILWDLRSNTKILDLSFNLRSNLKSIHFVPHTENILACFDDDFIQVWQTHDPSIRIELPPLIWFNRPVKNIVFSLDGKVMVLACRPHNLAVFNLSSYKMVKFITLPDEIQDIREIKFVPSANDGGAHAVIGVLSGRGIIHFYNISKNLMLKELRADYEIMKFCVCQTAPFVACLLSSGDVNVYDAEICASGIRDEIPQKVVVPSSRRKLKKLGLRSKKTDGRHKLRNMLEREKLYSILKEYGEYPEQYRTKIWEQLLQLPNNVSEYNAVINHRMIGCFEDLTEQYPLANRNALTNLRRVLDNLVNWNPFFHNVDYLPKLVFPFVKIFQNQPIACFEAVCTVIMNWCQYWFEYFPLPPINILALIENMLMEIDPQLVRHFYKHHVPATIYAWLLLKTLLSEVLSAKAWKVYWDHVLTNPPSFLLCSVVAYNTLNRIKLLNLRGEKKFHCFFNTHHPIDVRRLIVKTYQIMKKISPWNNPEQYLKDFHRINAGKYPDFCDYPKVIFKQNKIDEKFKKEMAHLKKKEMDFYKKQWAEKKRKEREEMLEEETNRLKLIENVVDGEISSRKRQLDRYRQQVDNLWKDSQFGIDGRPVTSTRTSFSEEERQLLASYSDLLRTAQHIENPDETPQEAVTRHQSELMEKIQEISEKDDKSERELKMLNLFTALMALNKLMEDIQHEIEKEELGNVSSESAANAKVLQLKVDAAQLDNEVKKLLSLLNEFRNRE